MKRILVFLILLLWPSFCLAAGFFCCAYSPAQQAAFFAASGSDSNICSQASPCKTLTRANGIYFLSGATLSFNGGDTFTGGITPIAVGPLTITSYGSGQATISSGNSSACVSATNIPSVTVNNIICTGGGSNTVSGITITNSQAGNTSLSGPTITNTTITSYGVNGIEIVGSNGSSGFTGVTISSNAISSVGSLLDGGGYSGSAITLYSHPSYGVAYAHKNVTISSNTIHDVIGTTLASDWSGSGIALFEVDNALITLNVVHDFAYSGHGSPGVWCVASNNITMRYNEVYNQQRTSGSNGGGFDFDGGTTNSLMEFNWAHDNVGFGILIDNYIDTPTLSWGNNTIRWNITQNNGGGELDINFSSNATGTAYIYNNTFVNQVGGNGTAILQTGTATITAIIANNIIAGASGTLVSVPHPTSLSFTGNDYYTYGQTTNFSWNGSSYASFAAWQTATGQEKIASINVGLTSNPQIYVPGGGFSNTGYVPANLMSYNLQSGSPMIGAGLNLTTQFGISPGTTDYYGVAITASALPVGAAAGDFTTFASSCTASTNFLARVSSFTKADNVNYNSMLCGMSSDGNLSLTDALYLLAAPNSSAALLNLVSTSFSLTVHGAPTFTARSGYKGNGSNTFLDTGFIPSTAAGNWALTSATMLAYDLTATASSDDNAAMGAANNAGTAESTIFPGSAGFDFYVDMNDFSGVTTAVRITPGASGVKRLGTTLTPYKNGVIRTGATVSAVALPNVSVYLMAYHNGGAGAADITTDSYAAHMFGGGTISLVNVSQRMNAFMMAYGINGY